LPYEHRGEDDVTRSKTTLLIALFASAIVAGDVDAQNQRAGVVTVATGDVSVARPPKTSAPLKFHDDVFVHDRIATGDRSLARILLGGKAVVTIAERSAVTITEIPGRSTIGLEGGKISLSVAHERMRPGDIVEIRTPAAVAGVRGTVVIAEVVPSADARSTSTTVSRFTVLKGLVEIALLDPTTREPLPNPTFLGARQQLVVDTRGVSRPHPISRDAAERLGAEFKTAPTIPPSNASAVVTDAQIRNAAEQARALNPDQPSHDDGRRGAGAATRDDRGGTSRDDRGGTSRDDHSATSSTATSGAGASGAATSSGLTSGPATSSTVSIDPPKADAPKMDRADAPKADRIDVPKLTSDPPKRVFGGETMKDTKPSKRDK
jgi:hypothetical protein